MNVKLVDSLLSRKSGAAGLLLGVNWLKLAEVLGRRIGPFIWVQAKCQVKVLG
jgi:hypothetical protein